MCVCICIYTYIFNDAPDMITFSCRSECMPEAFGAACRKLTQQDRKDVQNHICTHVDFKEAEPKRSERCPKSEIHPCRLQVRGSLYEAFTLRVDPSYNTGQSDWGYLGHHHYTFGNSFEPDAC